MCAGRDGLQDLMVWTELLTFYNQLFSLLEDIILGNEVLVDDNTRNGNWN